MSFFRLSTHFKSNTNITSDHSLIVAVVRELLTRRKQVIVVPDPMTQEEYDGYTQAGTPENFDPIWIADWISTIPEASVPVAN